MSARPVPLTVPAEPACIEPGEALTIYTVENFRHACHAALERSHQLRVDLAGVKTCDSLGVQVLLAARRIAVAGGRSIELANASSAVVKAAAALGCVQELTANGEGA